MVASRFINILCDYAPLGMLPTDLRFPKRQTRTDSPLPLFKHTCVRDVHPTDASSPSAAV